MPRFMRFAEEAIEKAGKAGERKREHAIRLAEMGTKARMAELEKAEAGLTRRKGMEIAGEKERKRLSWVRGTGELGVARERERGALEQRRLIESGLVSRYGPGGYEETRSPAALRLSEAIRQREEKKATGIYEAESERLLTPFLEGAGTEAILPAEINALRLKANVAETRKSGSGVGVLQKGIKEYEGDRLFLESLSGMSLPEMEALRTPAGTRLGGF